MPVLLLVRDLQKLEEAAASNAASIILDMLGQTGPDAGKAAGEAIALLKNRPSPASIFVRVNPLGSKLIDRDLEAVMRHAPEAIFLPRCESGMDLQHLGAKLAVHEAENHLGDGITRIVAIAETAQAVFALGSFTQASPRLAGLTWDKASLLASLGGGAFETQQSLFRTLLIFSAHAAHVPAIDTPSTSIEDLDAFRAECEAAKREGFHAKIALYATQVPIINAIFG
jgi:citrate lyase subunit beta/citryl-CoA lyase